MVEEYGNELEMGDQEQMRLAKLREMREMGIDPYPPRAQRTHMAKDAIAAYEEWERSQGLGARDQGLGPDEGTDSNPQPLIPAKQ